MPEHDVLDDLLDRALESVGPVEVDGLAARLDGRRRRRRRRRQAVRLVPIGAAAALLVVLVVVLTRQEPNAQVRTDEGTEQDGSGAYGFDPGWHSLDAGPLADAGVAASAWTGRELVVIGSTTPAPMPLPDGPIGAAFDPSTRRWRRIAPMPLPAGDLDSVWTGTELVVVRTATNMSHRLPDAAAAWDPVGDTWRRLPAPPPVVATGLDGTSWTGSEALFPSRLARFDPATSTWAALPDLPPDASGRFVGGWTGTGLVLATTNAARTTTLSWMPGAATWTTLAPPPRRPTVGAVVTADGRMILPVGPFEDVPSLAYDLAADDWSDLPDIDVPDQLCGPSAVGLAGTVAVNWCSTVAFLGADGRWVEVGIPAPQVPPGSVADDPGNYLADLVGTETVLFGLRHASAGSLPTLDLYVPSPDEVPRTAAPPPIVPAAPVGPSRPSSPPAWPTVSIGGATLDVPNGYEILGAADGENQTLVVAIPREPGWPPEAPCTITSITARDGIPATHLDERRLRSSEPDVRTVTTQFGNPPGALLHPGDEDATGHVLVGVSADEMIDIACDRLLTSRELAQYLR
jgi:hypothetical protein